MAKVIRESCFQAESAQFVKSNIDMKKTQSEVPSPIRKWVVLDGAMNPAWVDGMNTLLDQGKALSLANGEQIVMQGKHSLYTHFAKKFRKLHVRIN